MGASSEHVSDKELACPHCGVNGCLPETVDMLEKFRAANGNMPMRVQSAYRCQEHNKAVGGVADSQHVMGEAADVDIVGKTAAQLEAVARTIPEIRGIGRNDKGNWVHIDCRPAENLALWCYGDGGWCAYYPPEAIT